MDDYVSDNNPVHFIEAFVNNLDMNELSLRYVTTKQTGRNKMRNFKGFKERGKYNPEYQAKAKSAMKKLGMKNK